MKRALAAGLLCASLAHAQPPKGLPEAAPPWRAVGSAKMRWLGLHVYDITLRTAAPRFDERAPHALFIRYARSISGDALVKASLDQLRHLGFRDEGQLARWGRSLAAVFPGVRAGETLLGVHHPGVGAQFFHQGKATGNIDDPELARAFFAIWMDEKTSEPALRKKLLGTP